MGVRDEAELGGLQQHLSDGQSTAELVVIAPLAHAAILRRLGGEDQDQRGCGGPGVPAAQALLHLVEHRPGAGHHPPRLVVVAAGGEAHGLDQSAYRLVLYRPGVEGPKGPAVLYGVAHVHSSSTHQQGLSAAILFSPEAASVEHRDEMVPAKALWGWAKPLIVVSADAEVLVEHHLGVVVRDDGAARTRGSSGSFPCTSSGRRYTTGWRTGVAWCRQPRRAWSRS